LDITNEVASPVKTILALLDILVQNFLNAGQKSRPEITFFK
jgi:hypothetical protein